MKKLISLLLLFSLVFLLLPGAAAQAETPDAAARGLEKIKTARNWQGVVLPQEESYLDEWKILYTRKAWYSPSLPVMTRPELNSGYSNAPYVFEGTEVTVVAEENDMSCMLYRTPNYKLYVGWIQSIRLLEDFPGEQYTVGQPVDGSFALPDQPELSWAQRTFPGTDQRYSLLSEPVSGCVGFTYEYQLIDTNNSLPESIFGPRTIYVHDGEKWVEVGSFDYEELGTVRVQVWLDAPMDVTAIANKADCTRANYIEFRQTAQNFLIRSAK